MKGKVVVGDLTLERTLESTGGEKPYIVYSDPPWGEGNLRYWRTHNGQPDVRPIWGDFLTLFCHVVAHSVQKGGHVFVEMGVRWVDQLAEAMANVGLPESQRWTCVYGSQKLPNVLWHSGPEAPCDPSGMGGVSMTKHVLASVAKPNALVLDPCCGKGMTARCAIRLGMRFAGVELNPKRAAVTSAWIAKQ